VKAAIVGALYKPMLWPTLAAYLRQVLDGDGSGLAALTQMFAGSGVTGTSVFPDNSARERLQAIRCSDTAFRTNNLADVMPLVENFYQQSEISGDYWTVEQPLVCTQWPFRAKEVYSGRFENITTRHPILFIGNTFDPVTPLVSARNASAAFVDSQVLVQNGYGVSSVWSLIVALSTPRFAISTSQLVLFFYKCRLLDLDNSEADHIPLAK
jgi:hypothetical protein